MLATTSPSGTDADPMVTAASDRRDEGERQPGRGDPAARGHGRSSSASWAATDAAAAAVRTPASPAGNGTVM